MSRRFAYTLVAGIGLTVVLGLLGAWRLVYAWADRPGPLANPVVVEIVPGTVFGELARDLELAGVVESATLFSVIARLEQASESVRAGEYRFLPASAPNTVLHKLLAGDVVVYRLQILEGWTVLDLLDAAGEAPALMATLDGTDIGELLVRLDLGEGWPEGQFFPDTYHYVKGATDAELLLRAYHKMRSVMQEEWDDRAPGLPYTDRADALAMASLVEKETGLPEDRARVAGVFVRRLERGMRLQTDPSVIYGLGRDFDGDLTRADLDRDGPYNTYTRSGLPPTPIALPGRAAIHAALHPAREKFMYFVARGDGSSEFSETLAEHLDAVQRFQLGSARVGKLP